MKKAIIIFFTLILIFICCYKINVLPVVVSSDSKSMNDSNNNVTAKTFNFFEQYNFDQDNFSIYLVLSPSEKLRFSKVIHSKDLSVLNDLRDVEFINTGGDMSTCESFMYIMKSGNVILKVGITLDETMGIQSESFGWLEVKDESRFKDILNRFEQKFYPFIWL